MVLLYPFNLRSPGSQRPGLFACMCPPHERLQLWLDVQIEESFLVVDMQTGQYGLLLGRHTLDYERGLHQFSVRCLVPNMGPINITAVVLAATRQIRQLHIQHFEILLLQAVLQGTSEELWR